MFLAHIGSFVPAEAARIGVVDRILTRVYTVDSVLDGLSTFAHDVNQVCVFQRVEYSVFAHGNDLNTSHSTIHYFYIKISFKVLS